MSYDVSISILDAKGDPYTVGDWNYTSNLSGAWRAAGAQIHDWNGHLARYVTPELREAVRLLREDPRPFVRYEPDNGWGSVWGCLDDFLEPMLDRFERFPDAVVEVSR